MVPIERIPGSQVGAKGPQNKQYIYIECGSNGPDLVSFTNQEVIR
jgi:hypothetical protein